MDVFHVISVVQMVPYRATHHTQNSKSMYFFSWKQLLYKHEIYTEKTNQPYLIVSCYRTFPYYCLDLEKCKVREEENHVKEENVYGNAISFFCISFQ